MLLLSKSLSDVPIMSLQSSAELARTGSPIVDPRSLEVVALYVSGIRIDAAPSVLHVSDIREAGSLGYIVDDSSKIMPLDDLVRLQEVINFKFELIGNRVEDDQGRYIGKVSDFTYEPNSFSIQQLYVKKPLLRSFAEPTVIISRQQVISVTNQNIIVRSPTIKAKSPAAVAENFVNPFRARSQAEVESFSADRMS